MTQVIFGEDLAFAGLDSVVMHGVVENGVVSVRVSYHEAHATIGGFSSVQQAKEAITVAHIACNSQTLATDDQAFDLAIGFLSMVADKSFLLQQPNEADEIEAEGCMQEWVDGQIEEWQMERAGLL